jgi:hypothetical protein
MTVSFAKRESLIRHGETVYRAEPDALVVRRPDGSERRMAWADVRSVRAEFSPDLTKEARIVFVLRGRSGRIAINNLHFRGLGDFEDRTAGFLPLVLEAVERIRAAAPDAAAALGARRIAYVVQIAVTGGLLVALAGVLMVLPVGEGAFNWGKLLLVLAFLPVFVHWIAVSKPRRVAMDPAVFAAALGNPRS